jgi:ATP synthase protein I
MKPINYRRLAEATSLGLTLPSGIAIGMFIGYWLDKWLKTDPWMIIIWTLLGVASGLISLLRGLKKFIRDAEAGKED